jgi:hypothetical protein
MDFKNLGRDFRRFLFSKKGVWNLVLGGVIALVGIGIAVTVGVIVTGGFFNALPNQTDTVINETITNLKTAEMGAYNMMGPLPYIIVAGILIGALVVGFMAYRGKQ